MLRTKKKPAEGEEKTPKKSKLLSVPKLKKKTGDKTPKTPTADASPAPVKAKDATPVKPEAKKSVTKKSVKKPGETPERSSLSVPGVKTPPATTATKKTTKTAKSTETPLKPTSRAKSETTKRKTPTPELSKDSKTSLDRKSTKTPTARSTTPKSTATKSTTPTAKTSTAKSTTPTPKGAAAILSKEKKKKTKTGGETPKEKIVGVLKKIGSLGGKKNETPRDKKEKKSKKGLATSKREASIGAGISPSPGPQARPKSASEKSLKTSPGAKSATPKESASSTLSPAPEVQTETQTEALKNEVDEAVVERTEPVEDVIVDETKDSQQEKPDAEVEETVENPTNASEEAVEPTAIVEKPLENEERMEEAFEEKLPEEVDVSPVEAAKKPDPDDKEPPATTASVTSVVDTAVDGTAEVVEKDAVVIHDRELPSELSSQLMVEDVELPSGGMTGETATANLMRPVSETSVDVPIEVTRDEAAATAMTPAPASTASSANVAVGSEDLSVDGSLASTVNIHDSGEDELQGYLAVQDKDVERTEVRQVGPLSISSLSSVDDLDEVTPEEDVEPSAGSEPISESMQERQGRRDVIPGARELLEEDDYSEDDSSAGADLDTDNDTRSLGSMDLDDDIDEEDHPMETPLQKEPETQPQPQLQGQPQTVSAVASQEPIERVSDSDSEYQAPSLSSLSSVDPDDFIIEEEEEDMEPEPEREPEPEAPPVGLPSLGKLSGLRSTSADLKTDLQPTTKTVEPEPSKAVEPIASQIQPISEGPEPVRTEAAIQEQSRDKDPELKPIKTDTVLPKTRDTDPAPEPIKTDSAIQEQPRDKDPELKPIKTDTVLPKTRDMDPELALHLLQKRASEAKSDASVRTPEKKKPAPKGLPSLGFGLRPPKKAATVSPVKAQPSKPALPEPTPLPEAPAPEPTPLPEAAPMEAPAANNQIWDNPAELQEGTQKPAITVETSNESGSLAVVSDGDLDRHVAELTGFDLGSDAPDYTDNRTDEGRSPMLSPVPTLDGYHSGGFISNLSDEDFPDLSNDEVVPDVVEPDAPKVEKEILTAPLKRNISIDLAIPEPQPIVEPQTSQPVDDEEIEESRSKGKKGNTLISCAVYVLGGISGIAVTVLFLSSRGG